MEDESDIHGKIADCGASSVEPNLRIKQLTEYGNSVDIDSNIPPRRYYRSGLEMVRMANVYMEEGSLENAFILYMKFMTLFLEKIRTHPDFATVSVTDRATNSQKLREVMPQAENLKSLLLERYTKEYQKHLEYKRQREAEERAAMERRRELEELEIAKARSLKTKEEEDERGWMSDKEKNLWINGPVPMPSVNPEAVLPALDSFFSSNDFEDDLLDPLQPMNSNSSVMVPDRTLKPVSLELPSPTSDLQPSRGQSRPSVDRSTKPSSLLLSPSSLMIHGAGRPSRLRMVVIPSRLMRTFLALAQQNTQCNVETCGILAGKLHRDQLIVTHLLVPKQTGTADSCTTKNEEEIFDYQDQHDLITLGWIHTHPSQTAFLSSVDLHTHCSYQRMMPEAVAVVCAPRYNETGFYVLTPDYGLDFIANCRQTGFHPHPSKPPLFMEAEHTKLNEAAAIEVVDLRR
ncbi:STAM-binding protein-like A [Ischnura elegans]|uniref:STAM-binding protein-like A n=1 Tax=Ischnura elegans TaxID=197161 RepID=UPI001ED8B255|nr:STAM-binding protein-like A [Ischnura elegans]